MLNDIFECFKPIQQANYMVRASPQQPEFYKYETSPLDIVLYLERRQALSALFLVSSRLRRVAHSILFHKIWITDSDNLFGLVTSLALYPNNRPHVKRLGITKVFFDNCREQSCQCAGQFIGCSERSRHHVDWKTDKTQEETCLDIFNAVLKLPMIRTFPDLRQLLEM